MEEILSSSVELSTEQKPTESVTEEVAKVEEVPSKQPKPEET